MYRCTAAVALALGVLCSTAAAADTLNMTLNMRSWHHVPDPEDEPFNEKNFGLGLEYNYYRVGFYDNCYNTTSYYVGLGAEQRMAPWLAFGAELYLITGYRSALGYRALPMPALTVAVGPERLNARFFSNGVVTALQVRAAAW